MRKDTVAKGVRRGCMALCISMLALHVMTTAAQAVVRAIPGVQIQPPNTSTAHQSPVQPAGVTSPSSIQPAGTSVAPPPIKPTGQPGAAAPKLMDPDENDTDAERIRKLEATALVNAKRGSAADRLAARTSWLLGLLFLHGEHAPVDRAQAQKWFERAKSMNEPLGNAGLAWCEIDGCSGPPSPRSARPYLAPLKSANPGLALFLDWSIQERMAPVQGNSVTQSMHSSPEVQRMQLLQQAAQAGNASALNELGLINVSASRYDLAMQQFTTAAKRSPAAASNANLLSMRIEQNQKPVAGQSPSERAEGWFAQARRYHRGDGVPSNYAEAIRFYQLAAAAGYQPARRMLELIYSRPAPGGSVNVAWMRQLASMDVTAEGAILSVSTPPTPLLFVRDLTPLYEFIPQEWRRDRSVGQR
ncbi:sel1 repeat family protein [Diaphorobacter sp. HDW4A]|uniref:tetratricopeptide repeat protein n=1 Tax=Diaphorobacter sp. HDW4A TaxID=2714924 RepID=UPI00140C08A8|nr:tetratricopeptide repeat protein [Diaphorobacter sp. HDW4A]QIL80109.1 sel1 repeat family protein [Diaphorobacter sp. HDW4A]